MKDILPKMMEALSFAAQQHQYQRRNGYDRLPYINHLIKVVDGLIRVGGERDESLLLAAVLHDILEDTDIAESELSARFGDKVTTIVKELTDDMSISYGERKQQQVLNARHLSREARKIRIADKASNIFDIFHYPLDWNEEKKTAYVENAVQVVNQIRGANAKLEAWFDAEVGRARAVLNSARK